MKLYQYLPVPVPVPVKVRVSRSPRDCGVLIPHPKWDKSPSLFSCDGCSLHPGLVSRKEEKELPRVREKLKAWLWMASVWQKANCQGGGDFFTHCGFDYPSTKG